MRILIACECSGIVREAFCARGHDAWSCDLKPAEIDGPHIMGDVRQVLGWNWDMMIAHPECRYLTNSGSLRLYKNGRLENGRDVPRWRNMREAAEFFLLLWNAPIPKVCVENPIMHRHAMAIVNVAYTQRIQPWEFGEDASKATCLWLRGLPPLMCTNIIVKKRYANQTPSGRNKLGPSPDRPALRAKTYPGIADAMAEQWG